MLVAALVSVLLVGLTIAIHYEALRVTSALLPGSARLNVRSRMILVVFGCFAAHTIEVAVYAMGFWLLQDILRLDSIKGHALEGILDYVYFSATTYTSLGIGDVYPVGGARLLAGVEALNGLLLIAWSASFTYLVMERFWPLHRPPRAPVGARARDGRPWYQLSPGRSDDEQP